MAESQKGTSASTDPKKKNPSLDEEIGSEFFSSWKSISTARDDTMDFGFDTVSSGKKKAFNFDKLDMDFNLDGDFDKLTSFKVDMPDLEFSSPSRKTAEPKENSKGDSSNGNRQRKRDCFNFSFDFNELDNFNFGSNLLEGEKSSVKNLGIKGAGRDSSEHQSPKVNPAGDDDVEPRGSKINQADGEVGQHQGSKINLTSGDEGQHLCSKHNLVDADDDETDKFLGSENKIATVDGAGAEISSSDKFSSRAGNTDLVVSHGAKLLPQKTISVSTEEKDQQFHFPEKTIPIVPYGQRVTQMLPTQDVDGNDLSGDKESEFPSGSLSTKEDTEPSTELNASDRVNDSESDLENLHFKNSAASCTKNLEGNEVESEKSYGESPAKSMKESEPKLDDLDLQATYTASPLQEPPHEFKVDNDICKSTSKISVPVRRSCGVTLTDTVVSIEEKDSEVVTKPQPCQLSSVASKASSFGSKGISLLSPANGRSAPVTNKVMSIKDIDSEVVCSKVFKSSKETEPQLCQPTSLGLKISSFGRKAISLPCPANGKREGSNVNDQRKSASNSKSVTMELTKEEPALPESEKNVKNMSNISCQANLASLTDKEIKSTTQTSGNSLKMIPVEGLKAGKRMPDLFGLKISSIGIRKDQSNVVLERERSPLRNLEKIVEVQGITASKIIHPIVNTERKTLLIPSLKRKVSEAPNDNLGHLNPHKRFSQSPVESGNVKETSESTVEEQSCNHDDQRERDTKSVFYNHLTSGLELPQQLCAKEQGISLKNDGNVEKAEAYAKELEDICSMLKKKHEEAKEILVRAVVNNNSLLMLNHPMFDEKIRLVQKFAEQLMIN